MLLLCENRAHLRTPQSGPKSRKCLLLAIWLQGQVLAAGHSYMDFLQTRRPLLLFTTWQHLWGLHIVKLPLSTKSPGRLWVCTKSIRLKWKEPGWYCMSFCKFKPTFLFLDTNLSSLDPGLENLSEHQSLCRSSYEKKIQ